MAAKRSQRHCLWILRCRAFLSLNRRSPTVSGCSPASRERELAVDHREEERARERGEGGMRQKRYHRDNWLVAAKRSQRRCLWILRCRAFLSLNRRSPKVSGCSPANRECELALDCREEERERAREREERERAGRGKRLKDHLFIHNGWGGGPERKKERGQREKGRRGGRGRRGGMGGGRGEEGEGGDGLNPAHVPYWRVNNPTLWHFCVSVIGKADIEGSTSNVAVNAWLPPASYPCGSCSDTSS